MFRWLTAIALGGVLIFSAGCGALTTTGSSSDGSPRTDSSSKTNASNKSEKSSEPGKDTNPAKPTKKVNDFKDPG